MYEDGSRVPRGFIYSKGKISEWNHFLGPRPRWRAILNEENPELISCLLDRYVHVRVRLLCIYLHYIRGPLVKNPTWSAATVLLITLLLLSSAFTLTLSVPPDTPSNALVRLSAFAVGLIGYSIMKMREKRGRSEGEAREKRRRSDGEARLFVAAILLYLFPPFLLTLLQIFGALEYGFFNPEVSA